MLEISPAGSDLFASAAEAIVNPVNCVGVMGKGLALEFKQRFPENFLSYRRACESADRPDDLLGTVIPWRSPSGLWILNAPTKLHWRDPSRAEYVRSAMEAIDAFCRSNRIASCCMPALGCGLGGLDWDRQALPAIRAIADPSPIRYSGIAPLPSPARSAPSGRMRVR